jgi:hypothetical protein
VTNEEWLQVTLCLFSLGRTTQKHPEYKGPMIGPKMATENKRNFTEEQIMQGRNSQIGLQAGSNKGASQVMDSKPCGALGFSLFDYEVYKRRNSAAFFSFH